MTLGRERDGEREPEGEGEGEGEGENASLVSPPLAPSSSTPVTANERASLSAATAVSASTPLAPSSSTPVGFVLS